MLCKYVKANGFVLRQTPESDYSHFEGTWEQLEMLVKENFGKHTPPLSIAGGACVKVPLPPGRFRSAEALLSEGDELVGAYKSRIEGEEPRKQSPKVSRKEKPVALVVEIVLYQSSALEVDAAATPVLDPEEGNWEIISINAGLHSNPEIALETLLANQCGLSGGTPRDFGSPEEELEAIKKSFLYWKDKAMVTLES